MKDSEIETEIAQLIEAGVAAGQEVRQAWLVHAVVNARPLPEGEHADFYACCAYGHVAHCVRNVLRGEKAKEASDDDNLLLPGFKRLHRRYSVMRDSEQVIVPIEAMTVRELKTKADEYLAMARGNKQHADELLRYAGHREVAETVAA